MKATRFNRTRDLIFVSGRVWGVHGSPAPLRLVLDTGAAETIIVPEVLDELGYNPRQGEAITMMRSAVGREEGYMIRVARFACLGHHAAAFLVHAHDLPEGWGIDGLIGLSFLRQFNYEIRSRHQPARTMLRPGKSGLRTRPDSSAQIAHLTNPGPEIPAG